MIEYLDVAVVAALKQIVGGFGMFLVLALLLDWIGGKLQRTAHSLFGKGYDFVMLPGTMCRNAGEAAGCMLTGTKMSRSLFSLDGRDYEVDRKRLPVGTPMAVVKRMIIVTGPIWLGCALIICVSLLAGGTGLLPDTSGLVEDGKLPGMVGYSSSLLAGAVGMLGSMVFVWHWTSPFCLICLYLFFTIATKMSISHRELLGIMSGIIVFALLLFALNLVPGVGTAIMKLSVYLVPFVFLLHAILLFAFLLNVAFYLILRMAAKIFGKGKNYR